jgi:hypothetical protein
MISSKDESAYLKPMLFIISTFSLVANCGGMNVSKFSGVLGTGGAGSGYRSIIVKRISRKQKEAGERTTQLCQSNLSNLSIELAVSVQEITTR